MIDITLTIEKAIKLFNEAQEKYAWQMQPEKIHAIELLDGVVQQLFAIDIHSKTEFKQVNWLLK